MEGASPPYYPTICSSLRPPRPLVVRLRPPHVRKGIRENVLVTLGRDRLWPAELGPEPYDPPAKRRFEADAGTTFLAHLDGNGDAQNDRGPLAARLKLPK